MNNEIDYAWAAGFLDGEGHFGIHPQRQHGRVYMRPVISANQKYCDEPLLKLQQMFGGGIYHPPSSVTRWGIHSGDGCLSVIEKVLPYLTVKREVAVALQEFCEYLKQDKKKQRKLLTEEDQEVRKEFQKRVKLANHRTPGGGE